jgi:hypothetical protein
MFHVEHYVMRANLIVLGDEAVEAIVRRLPEEAKIILRMESRRRNVPVLAVMQEGVLAVAEAIVTHSGDQHETAA